MACTPLAVGKLQRSCACGDSPLDNCGPLEAVERGSPRLRQCRSRGGNAPPARHLSSSRILGIFGSIRPVQTEPEVKTKSYCSPEAPNRRARIAVGLMFATTALCPQLSSQAMAAPSKVLRCPCKSPATPTVPMRLEAVAQVSQCARASMIMAKSRRSVLSALRLLTGALETCPTGLIRKSHEFLMESSRESLARCGRFGRTESRCQRFRCYASNLQRSAGSAG